MPFRMGWLGIAVLLSALSAAGTLGQRKPDVDGTPPDTAVSPPKPPIAPDIKAVTDAGGVVNDTLDTTPVAILLDPVTVTAVAVSRRIEGKTLTFEARKATDGATAFYDKETGTRWNIEGLGEEGPLAGKALTRLDNHLSQWYGWSAYFPDTSIYGRTDPPKPGDPFAAK